MIEIAKIAAALGVLVAAATAGADAPPMPTVPALEFAFEELVTLGDAVPVGNTVLGGRNVIPITGGTFEGPDLRGSIVPGGWDWQLRRADGCTVIKADYMLRTDDGAIINVVNTGVACSGPDGKRLPIRTSPVFEAPLGKYEWLSRSAFVGTLDGTKINGKPAVRIRFFRVR